MTRHAEDRHYGLGEAHSIALADASPSTRSIRAGSAAARLRCGGRVSNSHNQTVSVGAIPASGTTTPGYGRHRQRCPLIDGTTMPAKTAPTSRLAPRWQPGPASGGYWVCSFFGGCSLLLVKVGEGDRPANSCGILPRFINL
jgi:hypothetical protein